MQALRRVQGLPYSMQKMEEITEIPSYLIQYMSESL